MRSRLVGLGKLNSTHRRFCSILSHNGSSCTSSSNLSINHLLEPIFERLREKPPSCGVEKGIQLVKELSDFEFGRFLIENKGWDGQWTSYAIRHASKVDRTLDRDGKKLSHMEDFILNRAPLSLATQERFEIFQDILQDKISNQNENDDDEDEKIEKITKITKFASIPSGVMDDILHLDFSSISSVSSISSNENENESENENNTIIELTGIDLDNKSLELAIANFQAQKQKQNFQDKVHFNTEIGDAWSLPGGPNRWDLITSNGLNIYVEDYQKTTDLYRSFATALKPGGLLLTSFVVPPDLEYIYDKRDLALSQIIFGELLNIKWQNYRTEEETISQLNEAGFDIELLQYDGQRLFPTVLAKLR